MNIQTPKPKIFQHADLSAILPGECFSIENTNEVYLMTNYDEIDNEYIIVNLYNGFRFNFTPSEADNISVIRMRVDATAEPYLNPKKE